MVGSRAKKIMVVIDTSMNISDQELAMFAWEIEVILAHMVMDFDWQPEA